MRKLNIGVWYGILYKLSKEWVSIESWSNLPKKDKKYFTKVEFDHLKEEIKQYQKEKKDGTVIK